MQDRLHPRVLLNLDAQALPAHTRRGLRRIVYIDGVHAQPRHQFGALHLVRAIDASRRHELHHGDELALREQRAQARPLRQRCRRRLFADRRRSARPLHVRLLIHGPYGRAHGANVIRRCAAASAHNLRTRGRSPCARNWPCIPANTGRYSGLRQLAASPAFGIAASGSVVAARMASIAVSTVAGPVEQFTPTAPAPHSVSSAAACPAEDAVQALALIVHRHHRQYRKLRRHGLRCLQRLVRFIQRRHSFNYQQVTPFRAVPGQHADLLGKGRARFVQAGLCPAVPAALPAAPPSRPPTPRRPASPSGAPRPGAPAARPPR